MVTTRCYAHWVITLRLSFRISTHFMHFLQCRIKTWRHPLSGTILSLKCYLVFAFWGGHKVVEMVWCWKWLHFFAMDMWKHFVGNEAKVSNGGVQNAILPISNLQTKQWHWSLAYTQRYCDVTLHWCRDLFMCNTVHIRRYRDSNVKFHWKVQGHNSAPE